MLEQKHMARDTRDPMRQVAWKLLRVSLSHFWRAPELVLFAFYLSSGTDSQTPKGHGQTPRAQSRTNSLWHRHARDAHAHACTPTPARPQNTCTYPAVVSSPSRGSYASSSACFGFLVLPHPSISDGSNGPAGALNPKPHTLNLGPHTRIQTAAMALWVPATRQQRQNTLAKTATSPTQPVLRALTCARHACRSKAAMGIVETPQVLSY